MWTQLDARLGSVQKFHTKPDPQAQERPRPEVSPKARPEMLMIQGHLDYSARPI